MIISNIHIISCVFWCIWIRSASVLLFVFLLTALCRFPFSTSFFPLSISFILFSLFFYFLSSLSPFPRFRSFSIPSFSILSSYSLSSFPLVPSFFLSPFSLFLPFLLFPLSPFPLFPFSLSPSPHPLFSLLLISSRTH